MPPADLLDVARRVVWFKPPEDTLADPVFFLAHQMRYGRSEDVLIARRHCDDAAFRSALDQALPGIFDPRSWAYWNADYGRIPAPIAASPPASLARLHNLISLVAP